MRVLIYIFLFAVTAFSQIPAIEPGVSQELAKWRAAHYSDVRYKLNLTLEKMSPVLKGTIEIRLKYVLQSCTGECPEKFIVLDWRKIRGSENLSTIKNVSINGRPASLLPAGEKSRGSGFRVRVDGSGNLVPDTPPVRYEEHDEHLIFSEGIVDGFYGAEDVIRLDFTSPILTSGSAITRYVDKEDGAEYIYSLFVPSDASTVFPVFDQPDLKARFSLTVDINGRNRPTDWKVVSNTSGKSGFDSTWDTLWNFEETKPISTYVFAFAAGPFERVAEPPASAGGTNAAAKSTPASTIQRPSGAEATPPAYAGGSAYVRKSQAAKFKPHAPEVFRLNREAVKYLETYFDYKFPFPKYDLVLIPEFPFGGMEHAGATFLREQSVIFAQEPTKNDIISRAVLIFHEAAHQWFGDIVTMKWFDDLWLKEGFAEFMAYKTLEKVMPEANAWKVFYERNKQAAYATDSTKGTTPIYQPIANLNSAKSAYGNIVYRKAPSFLRQAEFYLGEEKFQTAVRAFLKKHEFANAGWEDLVKEFEVASGKELRGWAKHWVIQPGVTRVSAEKMFPSSKVPLYLFQQEYVDRQQARTAASPSMAFQVLVFYDDGSRQILSVTTSPDKSGMGKSLSPDGGNRNAIDCVLLNAGDYGYGIFLLDDKSRDYVLKNIQNEKDDFLRTMMWGSLWDSVREGELDPKEYVELVIKVLSANFSLSGASAIRAKARTQNAVETDEGTIQTLLARVTTAMNYYMNDTASGGNASVNERALGAKGTLVNTRVSARNDLRSRLEDLLIDKIQNAATQGQRITYYRAFLNIASTDKARGILKQILSNAAVPAAVGVASRRPVGSAGSTSDSQRDAGVTVSLRTKDKFDIVTRLAILDDPDAPKLLADLEKSETTDDAKRYAYAAKAAFGSAENKAKFWNDFLNNKDISESWIEAAFGPFNAIRHSDLTSPYLEKALAELPNLKRSRKIFFVNGWLSAFIGGQRDEKALAIINKFLADNPNLDNDLRLKILENSDLIERAAKIRAKYGRS